MQLKTGISKVRWLDPCGGKYQFAPAVMKEIMAERSATEMCWFDELFYGGIDLPDPNGAALNGAEPRARTLLITGPPGTGKSTLALELCVRMAVRARLGKSKPRHFLYFASEGHPPWMIDNVKKFGWLQSESGTVSVSDIFDEKDPAGGAPILIRPFSEAGHRENPAQKLDRIIEVVRRHCRLSRPAAPGTEPSPSGLDIVVIDSLNDIETGKGGEFTRLYDKFVTAGPGLIIFILDSAPSTPEPWEFAADNVIRLDYEPQSGYMVRTLQITKARYQSHVWGKHQLKITTPRDPQSVEQRLRAHPWGEGGIFIFPSIHYILSRYKRAAPDGGSDAQPPVATPIASLTHMLGGGIPAGSTTALLGARGAHKSHLGFFQAIHNVKCDGCSLIINLRDDEALVRQTLTGFLHPGNKKKGEKKLNEYLANGSLEILNYMPGYVTPEEFFHRLLLSIYRMRSKSGNRQTMLLFNSLDQIASRFPLCAEERVFIPGIIQTLSSLDVTSVFVGADTEGADKDESLRDLLSMAELILRITPRELKPEELQSIPANVPPESRNPKWDGSPDDPQRPFPQKITATVLRVERYAGGKPAGSEGLLELVSPESPFQHILAPGLQFVPFRPPAKNEAARK